MTRYEMKQSGVMTFWSRLAVDGIVIAEDIEWRCPWEGEWGSDYNGEGVSVTYDEAKMEVLGSFGVMEGWLPMPDWLKQPILTYERRDNRDRIAEQLVEHAAETRSRL